jgi:hypothetical protein
MAAGYAREISLGPVIFTCNDDGSAEIKTSSGTLFKADKSGQVALFGATLAARPTAYTQTYSTADKTVASPTQETLTDSTTGTASNTLAAGVGKYLLSFPITLAQISGSADVVTAVPIPHKFKILSVDAYVAKVVTTGAKAATLNLEINTTDLTGGAVALTSANCTPLGAKIAGSAVSAANTGAADATISVESSAVTAFAEGEVTLVVAIQNMDTADAFASLKDEHDKGVADDLDNRKSITAIIDDLQALGLVQ